MNILYPLLCYYPSESGGQANTLYWLNKSLSKTKIKSHIIATKYGLPKHNINTKQLYGKYDINVKFISGSFFSFFYQEQILKIKKSDIIHFSSLFFKPTLFYILLGLLWNKKIIISPRGELYSSALSRKRLIKTIYIYILKLFSKKIKFHSTNEIEKNLILEYFPKNKGVTVIPNFIEMPKIRNLKKKKQILFLGRINPIKNIHLLIEAYSQLPENLKSSFKLKIVGEAKLDYEKKYKSKLENLIKKNNMSDYIEFLGPKYQDEKEKIISESYCLVLPSKSENFGNVILEALSQKTPVIVSKYTPWKNIDNYRAGYCIDTNIDDIKNKLETIMNIDKEEYRILQKNSLNLVREKFDVNDNIDCWLDYYKN